LQHVEGHVYDLSAIQQARSTPYRSLEGFRSCPHGDVPFNDVKI
jgi:hypothetical protein